MNYLKIFHMNIAKKLVIIIFLTILCCSCNVSHNRAAGSNSSINETDSIDLKGRIITIGVTSKAYIPQEGYNEYNDLKIKCINEAEKAFNCKIEWEIIKQESTSDITSGLASGKKIADIIYLSSFNNIIGLVKNNCLLPLDEYIDFSKGLDYENSQKSGYIGSHYYGISDSLNIGQGIITYNKSLIEH